MSDNLNSTSAMGRLLSDPKYQPRQFRYGDLVEGRVVSKSHDGLLVDVGAKAEGVISGKELEDGFGTFDRADVGDTILCFVVQAENDQGFVVLSLRRAAQHRQWLMLHQAKNEGQPFEVQVVGHNRGGLIVDLGKERGFVPTSHLDPRRFSKEHPVSDLSFLIGEVFKAKIIEVDRGRNRIVLSEKEVLSDFGKEHRKERLRSIKEADEVSGVVSAVLPFGVFIYLGDGLEGLLHQNEISWFHSESDPQRFEIGDKLTVRVISKDLGSERVSLSVRALTDNPWEKVKGELKVGQRISGEVSKIASFGAFIRLDSGVEGLVHLSDAKGPLKVGEKVDAAVVAFDESASRLSLSTKETD